MPLPLSVSWKRNREIAERNYSFVDYIQVDDHLIEMRQRDPGGSLGLARLENFVLFRILCETEGLLKGSWKPGVFLKPFKCVGNFENLNCLKGPLLLNLMWPKLRCWLIFQEFQTSCKIITDIKNVMDEEQRFMEYYPEQLEYLCDRNVTKFSKEGFRYAHHLKLAKKKARPEREWKKKKNEKQHNGRVISRVHRIWSV